MSVGRSPLVLGVDAGNSKTVAVVADATGSVLGYGRAGCGDIYGVGAEPGAVVEVLAAVGQALAMAGAGGSPVAPSTLTNAAFCLAGVDWDSDLAFWRAELARTLPDLGRFSLHNDGFALLRAGNPDGRGVAVSVGTGGAVVARGPERQEWSASFWIVDGTGGSSLGAEAYAAVVRAELGIGPTTRLTGALLAEHGYADVESLLEGTTSRGTVPVRHAAMARAVLDAARDGDAVAAAIVTEQARWLAAYAEAAMTRVGWPADPGSGPGDEVVPVVLGGSVLSSTNPALRDATTTALRERISSCRVVSTPRSPVVGAVAEALAESPAGLRPDALSRLTSFRFPAAFLLT